MAWADQQRGRQMLGAKVRARAIAQGLKQDDAAKLCHLSTTTYREVVRNIGTYRVQDETLRKLAEHLDLDLEELCLLEAGVLPAYPDTTPVDEQLGVVRELVRDFASRLLRAATS